MQQFTVVGEYVDLRVRASRGLVFVAVYGLVHWVDFFKALQKCAKDLNEPQRVWLIDYTSAKICKLPHIGHVGLKHHHFDGVSAGAAAFIVPNDVAEKWRAQIRDLRGIGKQKAVFTDDHRQSAVEWAAYRAQLKRATERPSSVLGLLEVESVYRVI